MKFTRKDSVEESPDAILTSDWHIREDTPECRVDDFFATQTRKLNWLHELQEKYNCPVFNGGDMFDHWKPSPHLIRWTMGLIPKDVWTVPGQHDLAQHSMELFDKSGLSVLLESDYVHIPFDGGWTNMSMDVCVDCRSWNGKASTPRKGEAVRNVLLTHEFVWLEKPNIPKILGRPVKTVTDEYGDMGYDLVVSGDNHKSFEYLNERNGCCLVNPGCLMRQSATEIDYQPRVALWYASTNTVKWIPVPIEIGAVTRQHLETAEQREDRIDAFVTRMQKDFEVELSFEKNMESYLATNRTHPEEIKLINECMERV